jgi:hypothetical protein
MQLLQTTNAHVLLNTCMRKHALDPAAGALGTQGISELYLQPLLRQRQTGRLTTQSSAGAS